jgi:DNA (cytosine-5)-methyltransferase 1
VGRHIIEVADEFIDLESWEYQPSEQQVNFTSLGIDGSQAQQSHLAEDVIRTEIPSYQHHFMNLSAGKSVELGDGDFMRIEKIFQDDGHNISVEGKRFRRTWQLEGILEKKPNEVCQIIERKENEGSPGWVVKRQLIDVTDVLCLRDLRLTNLLFPEASFRTERKFYFDLDVIHEQAPLTCRWKLMTSPTAPNERRPSTWKEQSLERLTPAECDLGRFIELEHLRQQFRGETVKGGSSKERSNSRIPSVQDTTLEHRTIFEHQICDLTDEDQQSNIRSGDPRQRPQDTSIRAEYDSEEDVVLISRIDRLSVFEIESNGPDPSVISISDSEGELEDLTPAAIRAYCTRRSLQPRSLARVPLPISSDSWSGHHQSYTFGDAFCGCGGTSRGAMTAKLQIDWGFDFNLRAIEAYKSNFSMVDCIHKAADEFLKDCDDESTRERYKVDILHISPPCQPFSPAHTVMGRDDERNEASLFAIDGLLEKIRPRVVTMEETFGLLSRHPLWFRSVLHMFTRHNYSVRWKIINCQDYGIPQARRRLVLIGSWLVILPPIDISCAILIDLQSR